MTNASGRTKFVKNPAFFENASNGIIGVEIKTKELSSLMVQ